MIYVVHLSRKSRHEAQRIWNDMCQQHGLDLLPQDLVDTYQTIYRSVLSEVSVNILTQGDSPERSLLTLIDYSGWCDWLSDGIDIPLREWKRSARRGSSMAKTYLSHFDNTGDGWCDIIGWSILDVMPAYHELREFELSMWDDITDANIRHLFYDDEAVGYVRPGLSRLIISDDLQDSLMD